jgi:hypothetical protein
MDRRHLVNNLQEMKMNKTVITLGMASALAFSTMVNAEQALTLAEMDGITAAGSATASALADAIGASTSTFADTFTNVVGGEAIPGQVGAIYPISSTAAAVTEALAQSSAVATALGDAAAATVGTGLSETAVASSAVANADALIATSANTASGIATALFRGESAAASAAANSFSALNNP